MLRSTFIALVLIQLFSATLAGKLAAIAAKMQILSALSTYKPPIPPFRPFKFGHFSSICLDNRKAIGMALAEPQWNSPEAKGPSPKVPKLLHHPNGADLAPAQTLPLLKVKKLSQNATLPSRASALSAGYDLASATETKVPARGKTLIPTDLSIAIPEGTYGRIAPRSGLAWKHSIDVGAGVIDGDYRGPIGVILFNHSDKDFEVKVGDRIAQLILEKILMPEVSEVEDLDATERGDGGFGSTGV